MLISCLMAKQCLRSCSAAIHYWCLLWIMFFRPTQQLILLKGLDVQGIKMYNCSCRVISPLFSHRMCRALIIGQLYSINQTRQALFLCPNLLLLQWWRVRWQLLRLSAFLNKQGEKMMDKINILLSQHLECQSHKYLKTSQTVTTKS